MLAYLVGRLHVTPVEDHGRRQHYSIKWWADNSWKITVLLRHGSWSRRTFKTYLTVIINKL